MHGQGRSGARAPPPTRPLIRQPPRRGGTGTDARPPLLPSRPPPERANSRDTLATAAGTRGGHRVKGNDATARPQAPEGQPGALQGHHRGATTRHAHTPTRGTRARQRHSPPHRRGGEARASAVSRRPTGPRRLTPRGGGADRRPKVRARDRTQPLPSSPSPTGRQGGKDGRGVPRTDREERARPPGTPVPRPARLRLGPGEHDHTTSITV